ncbi:MAG TPA: hypothetical protein VGG89_14725 [Candidatus Baltobacteraceae bacterium]|jgi:hypothetical protein
MLTALVLAAATLQADSNAGYEIFGKTRLAWESQRYPELLAYDVAVTVTENGRQKTERYRSAYDAVQDVVHFNSVSDYEEAHPYYAPGGFGLVSPFDRIHSTNAGMDFLGIPMLAPNYSFGLGTTPRGCAESEPNDAQLVEEIRQAFRDPMPRNRPAPAPEPTSGLREIAVVEARSRTYAISLVGIENAATRPAYHLRLQPLRDPGRFRLRELWVDTRTYAPIKLVEALNFVTGPGTAVPWSITFDRIGEASYIATETALAPIQLKKHGYSSASVSFENVRSVARIDAGLSTFVPDDTLILTEPQPG